MKIQTNESIDKIVRQLISNQDPETAIELLDDMFECVLLCEHTSEEKKLMTLHQYTLINELKKLFNEALKQKQLFKPNSN